MPQPCVLTAVVHIHRSHRSTHMLSPCKFSSVRTSSYLVHLYAPSPEPRTRTVQSSGRTELEPELNHQFGSAGITHQFSNYVQLPTPHLSQYLNTNSLFVHGFPSFIQQSSFEQPSAHSLQSSCLTQMPSSLYL